MRQAFVVEQRKDDGTMVRVPVVRAEVFRRWRRRATGAFAAVVLMSALGIFLAQHAGSSSDTNLRLEAKRAVTRSCLDRMDVRVAVAVSFDDLRRLAVPQPRTQAERLRIGEYIERTQEPIDRLLSDAAGATVKTNGELTNAEIERVRSLGTVRCEALGERFDRNASAGD